MSKIVNSTQLQVLAQAKLAELTMQTGALIDWLQEHSEPSPERAELIRRSHEIRAEFSTMERIAGWLEVKING